MPSDHRLSVLPFHRKPDVPGDARIFHMSHFFTGKRSCRFRAAVRLCDVLMPSSGHGTLHHFIVFLCKPFSKGRRLPPIRHSDIQISVRHFQHTGKLSMKRGSFLIAYAGISQILIGSVPVRELTYLAGIRVISRRSAGKKVVFIALFEKSRRSRLNGGCRST